LQVLEARRVHDHIVVDAGVIVVESDAVDEAVSVFLSHVAVTLAVAVFTYLTILGFTGGSVPGFGWQLPGGVLPGLVWFGVMSTLGVAVIGFAPLLAASALARALVHVRSNSH
jgi:preprotein translocase subunit SecF